MDIAHDHEVGRVPEDPPEALYLAAVAEVLGGEGVPELVGVDPEADSAASQKLDSQGDFLSPKSRFSPAVAG